MNKSIIAFSLLLAGGFAGNALAGQVTCASNNGKYQECPLDGSGDIVMKRQLSKTDCVKDKTWGETGDGVYVKNGCRAIFETMSMEPPQGMNGGGSGYKDLIGAKAAGGESSLQSRGYTWIRTTTQRNSKLGYWSTPDGAGCIQVTTNEGRYSAIQNVNASQCGEGNGASSASANTGQAPAAAMRACNTFADQGYDGTVISQSPLKPGMWEIILRFEQYQYFCNVSSSGEVSSFNIIN